MTTVNDISVQFGGTTLLVMLFSQMKMTKLPLMGKNAGKSTYLNYCRTK
jgi:hypothetical protein